MFLSFAHSRTTVAGFSAVLVLSAALIISNSDAAHAETEGAEAAERRAFVSDNTVFTLYHELGHALIDLLEVHVLGREEDAVDALAVLLSSDGRTPEAADAMIASAAESFAILDEWAAAEGEELVFWGEHSLDPQRFYNIICLYYGGEPDALSDLADDAALPEERRELCIEERAQVEHAWRAVLDKMDREKSTRFTKGLRLIRETPSLENQKAAGLLVQSQALALAVAVFNQVFATPEEIAVTLDNCGEANAFYDPETSSITLCYELIGEFAGQIDWVLENSD